MNGRLRRRPDQAPRARRRGGALEVNLAATLEATAAEVEAANESEHWELASAGPAANEDEDPHGVDPGVEYHGPEHDDEYLAIEDWAAAGRRMEPDLVVCPRATEGERKWTVVVQRPGSVAGVDARRQATVRQRNRLFRDFVLAAVGGHLVELQSEYLESGNPVDLQPISSLEAIAEGIEAIERRLGGGGDGPATRKIDKSRVARALAGTGIELPTGDVVPLRALAPNRQAQVLRFIAAVFREDRASNGLDGLVGRTELTKRVTDRFSPMPEASLRRMVSECHLTLPLDPEDRMEAYRKGEDWWTSSES